MSELERCSGLFKILGDETRLRILNLLFERELCVCDVMRVLDFTQSRASRHLLALKRAGLASDRKEAQWTHYSLVPGELEAFLSALKYRLREDARCQEDLKELELWLEEKQQRQACQ
ncbi:MAG: metalloregulator ArsR/SmtB family transcription factor [Fretibacterium sp.]|nr:metalloregulator ArsR/SmtB family transcription factor [Fretibacterium sp.]